MLTRLFRFRRKPELTSAELNAQTIREIPLEQFPDGPARRKCIERALEGEMIQGYRPAYLPDHIIQTFDNEHGFVRYTAAEWARHEGYALTDDEQMQIEIRGICAEADCEGAVEGWCAICHNGPKLCAGHLLDHVAETNHTIYSLRLRKEVNA